MKRLALLACLLLSGCATTYGPNFMTGGYKERMLAENRYIVSFFGNGYAQEQRVWNFWIYRCAQLTVEKGYDLFMLEPSSEHALLQNPQGERPVEFTMLDASAGETGTRVLPVQYYSYSVTTYSSKAVVNMYRLPVPADINVRALLDARSIMEQLQPYIDADAKIEPPARKDLFVRAAVEATIKARALDAEQADKLRGMAM
ncbi:hypothetical protein D0B54_00150 [Solimonas sp. K1W22B-7]|uniref:CC0125/CC1285 family lipoprotein n=1 Tax=Solimonas sp. K1W22B-7 TaxID=2303331 RepID=UPI000E337BC4|nr:hypothetical protein [Solimonas sp. K1W22B-7]AXQ27195.1 hypothetical protein D0B54_00150 [Solimonas sp. K1W22B-7]